MRRVGVEWRLYCAVAYSFSLFLAWCALYHLFIYPLSLLARKLLSCPSSPGIGIAAEIASLPVIPPNIFHPPHLSAICGCEYKAPRMSSEPSFSGFMIQCGSPSNIRSSQFPPS